MSGGSPSQRRAFSLMEATSGRRPTKRHRRIRTSKARHISGLEPQFFDKEINLMKSAFPILAAVALLIGASTAHAARPIGQGAMSSNRNIILPAPPVESSLPPTTNSVALDPPILPQTLGT